MSSAEMAGIAAVRPVWSPCNVRRPYPKDCCIRIPKEIVHDPDPATYDQQLLFSTGLAPTFNSPDVETADLWPVVAILNLDATVRNLSTEASANQTRVDVSWSAWGIGMPRMPVATSFVESRAPASPAASRPCPGPHHPHW